MRGRVPKEGCSIYSLIKIASQKSDIHLLRVYFKSPKSLIGKTTLPADSFNKQFILACFGKTDILQRGKAGD